MNVRNPATQLHDCMDDWGCLTQSTENIFGMLRNGLQKIGLATLLTGIVGYSGSVRSQEPVSEAGREQSEAKEQTSKIAFVSRRDGNDEIYLMNSDGSHLENITNDESSDTFPAWSPDGTMIAFQSDRDGNPNIYVMNSDGRNVEILTDDTTEDDMPAWSPDGKRIAYVAKQGSNFYIYVMNANGSERKRLTMGMLPSWSPDGKRIAFNAGQIPQMYVMDSDGDNIAPLITTLRLQVNISPIWSPDGKSILFTRVLLETPTGAKRPEMNYEVFTMDTDGGNQKRLTLDSGWDVGKGWSPRGREIVFETGRDGHTEIYIMNSDGSNQRRLTTDPARDYDASWSPILSSK